MKTRLFFYVLLLLVLHFIERLKLTQMFPKYFWVSDDEV